MGRFDGKRIFITGAGSGFGRRTSERFAEEGASVIYMVDRLQDRLDLSAEAVSSRGAEAVPICFDLADGGACADAMAQALDGDNHLDVLVCNAAQIGRSTRLNSSHKPISYAVFCLKKKKHKQKK